MIYAFEEQHVIITRFMAYIIWKEYRSHHFQVCTDYIMNINFTQELTFESSSPSVIFIEFIFIFDRLRE